MRLGGRATRSFQNARLTRSAARVNDALEHAVVLLGLPEDTAAAAPAAHEVHDPRRSIRPRGVHAHGELEHVVAVGQVGALADHPGSLGHERVEAA